MEPFAKAFDQLRREYLAEAAARLSELRDDTDRFRDGDPDALNALRTRFHRLVGSGGSYGFPEISSVARDAERRLGTDPPPAPLEADWLDDVIDRLAVLFTEAEQLLRTDVEGSRLAVIAGPDGDLTDDLQDALTSAGFGVRKLPADARPDDIARPEAAQVAVLLARGPSTYAAAAAWSSAPAPVPRAIVLVETTPVDRLRAAVAGVEVVLPVERAPIELARLAQRLVMSSAPRYVAVLADDDAARAAALAEGLSALGMEVRRAGAPEEAQAHLDLAVPDLVVASATLPDGGGRALARLVRQDPRCVAVPVVLLGALSPEDRLAALREGVDEVLTGSKATTATVQELRARAERGRRVRELVRRDPLTGALTDPAFRAELDHAAELARRDRRPLAVLSVTVTELEAVNTRHGAATGDRLLAHAVAVIRATVRQSDLVGRRGGRSFDVLLRGSTAGGAAKIASKLEAMFAEHPYEMRDGGVVRVGVGIELRAES
jgi:diguanylate cyclase (GGDEF)-like protein